MRTYVSVRNQQVYIDRDFYRECKDQCTVVRISDCAIFEYMMVDNIRIVLRMFGEQQHRIVKMYVKDKDDLFFQSAFMFDQQTLRLISAKNKRWDFQFIDRRNYKYAERKLEQYFAELFDC